MLAWKWGSGSKPHSEGFSPEEAGANPRLSSTGFYPNCRSGLVDARGVCRQFG